MDQVELMAYASPLARNPEATYRQIDLAGRTAQADGPALVQLLYEELIRALHSAAHATDNRRFDLRADRVTRATAILFALEAGLDFENGGALSNTLATLYRGARQSVVASSLGLTGTPFREAASTFEDIAGAWRTARAA